MISVLLLLGAIGGTVVQNVTKRISNDKSKGKGAFLFAAISAASALLVFLCNSFQTGINLQPEVLPYSIGFAVTYSMATIFLFLAISTGSLALTSLIVSYALILPTMVGIFYLKEPTDAMLFIGIGLLLVSLLFINMGKSKERVKITPKWLLFVTLAFIGNGGCSTFANLQQRAFGGDYKNEFMIVALLMVVAVTLLAALLSDAKGIPAQFKAGALWNAFGGVANGLVNLFVLMLMAYLPASVMFPLISAGGTVAMVAVSMLFYKEKLSWQQLLAVVLGIGAIVFLNL